MNRDLLQETLIAFLETHCDVTRPLLLALSGGPDSLALLHLLLDYQTQRPLRFGIVHVDHRWRPESSVEATQLQQLAEGYGIPFYLKILDPTRLQGNLEAVCRQERLCFFAELCRAHDYQAVLLGHHADDQSETVLKRVLEGTSLASLGGLQGCMQWEDIQLWRPLLEFPKAAIVQWLEARGLRGFEDQTNADSRFLRGRLRVEVIPSLSRHFGKEVSRSLCHLGREAQELRTYLEKTLSTYLSAIEQGPHGALLDLTEQYPIDATPLKFLIHMLCKQEGFYLSRQQMHDAARLVWEGTGDRYLEAGRSLLYIDRRRLFAMRAWEEKPLMEIPLQLGQMRCGAWTITTTSVTNPQVDRKGWKAAWKGNLAITLPMGDYRIGPPHLQAAYPGLHAPLSKWWTNEKIPAILRYHVPVIWQGEQIYQEFLSDRMGKQKEPTKSWLFVQLSVV